MSNLTLGRPKTGLLTTTSLGIDTDLFKPVYLGRNAHGVDPWNAGDTITAGTEGVVFARHRDQLAMCDDKGEMPVYGYTIPYTSWSNTYGEGRDRSNERAIARDLKGMVRHVEGPAGTSHLLMIKAEGLLHQHARALRELTTLGKDTDSGHTYDEIDLLDLTGEVYDETVWLNYREDICNEIAQALRWRMNIHKATERVGVRDDDWLRREFDHTTYNIFDHTGCTEHSPFELCTAVDIDVPHWRDAAWVVGQVVNSTPAHETQQQQLRRHARRQE